MSRLTTKSKPTKANSIMGATILMMIALIFSKLTGQLREILAVNRFGYGSLVDAYTQGFLIPDFLYELLIGGSIQAVIVPTLSGAIDTSREKRAWRSVSIFISFASVLMLTVLIICELNANRLMRLFTRIDTHALATDVAHILLPQTFFMMLAALCIGVLNSYRKFTLTAFGPVFYNVLVVASIIAFGGPTEKAVHLVAAGVLGSAIAYFLLQAFLGRDDLSHYRFSLDLKDKGFRHLVRLAIPTLLASSIPQLNNLILNSFMRDLPVGTPISLRQSTTLWMLPWGVFAVAIGNVLLPSISKSMAADRHQETAHLLSAGLKRALYLTVPCALLFFFARYDIVKAVYQWSSAVEENAILVTGGMLLWFCPTIVTHTCISIMNQAYFAARKTFMPLISSIISLILTSLGGYIFSQHTSLGASGLSLGFALGSLAGAIFILVSFSIMYPRFRPRGFGGFIVKIMISSLGIVMVMLPLGLILGDWNPASKLMQLVWLAARLVMALLAYGAISYLLDMEEIHNTLGALTRRLKRR